MRHILQSPHLGLIPVVLILSAITLTGCSRRVVSVEQVENMIKEQASVGSDKKQVRAFIDNLKIDSLKIGRGVDFDQATPDALMGHRDDPKVAELGGRIAMYTWALIYRSHEDFLSTDNILIMFYLDQDARLIGYTVHESGSD